MLLQIDSGQRGVLKKLEHGITDVGVRMLVLLQLCLPLLKESPCLSDVVLQLRSAINECTEIAAESKIAAASFEDIHKTFFCLAS